MGDPQGGIPNFPSLFTENSAKQTFFRSQFGFAFGRDLTN